MVNDVLTLEQDNDKFEQKAEVFFSKVKEDQRLQVATQVIANFSEGLDLQQNREEMPIVARNVVRMLVRVIQSFPDSTASKSTSRSYSVHSSNKSMMTGLR